MMDKAQLKQKVCQAIAARRTDIEALAHAIAQEPELGFKEVKTAAKVKAAFDVLGMDYSDGWAVTGVKARLKGKRGLKTVALLGELDAIICREHPQADPVTGAAHSCGHNVQIANLLAVAMAFRDADVMAYLDGDVVFFAVPAEEYVEIDYRNKLRQEGRLRYLGGKEQIIAEGGFDDVDMALQMHTNVTDNPEGFFELGASCNGFIGKIIEYRGVPAHAAAAPDKGVNALNAAMMGVMGVNAIRETFRDDECVRFHPIINSGGDLVNVIPDYVSMESYVRAANLNAMKRYNDAIDRALKAGADAVGAKCEIQSLPGYLPLQPSVGLRDLMRQNAESIFGEDNVGLGEHAAGSTDMGDVSHIMPVVHPWIGCASGVLHGANYRQTHDDVAFTKVAQVLAMTIIDLLYDGARSAEEICKDFRATLTRESYCEYMDSIK